MNTHLVIFVLALIGICEAIYLAYCRSKNRIPVCIIGDKCGSIWESPYSRTFGVPNEILGIIFYSIVANIEWVIFLGNISPLVLAGEYAVILSGFIMSCYFLYLEWRIIRAWCFWCTLSAVIVWVMVAVRFLL